MYLVYRFIFLLLVTVSLWVMMMAVQLATSFSILVKMFCSVLVSRADKQSSKITI